MRMKTNTATAICSKCNGTGRYLSFGPCFDCGATGRRAIASRKVMALDVAVDYLRAIYVATKTASATGVRSAYDIGTDSASCNAFGVDALTSLLHHGEIATARKALAAFRALPEYGATFAANSTAHAVRAYPAATASLA